LFALYWADLSAQFALLKVVDSIEKKPVSEAHVLIEDFSGIKFYEITNAKGEVKNPLTESRAIIKISHVGFENIYDTIQPNQSYTFFLLPSAVNVTGYVVTSHAIPTKINESVFNVTVIDKQRIQAQAAMNLRDLLLQDVNIKISQDAILGSGIKMQGIGGENVKIMIDGVPVIGRLDGNIDLSQLPLNNIEQVEIIQGPSSVTYGTNALGGVINLITKKNVNHLLEGNINAYYESVGNYNVDGRVSFQKGKQMIQLSGGRYFFDGYTTTDSIKRFFQWKPKEQYFAELQMGRGIGKMNLRLNSGFFHEILENKGVPESPFYITATDQYFRTIRTQHSAFLTGFFLPNHHLDITVSYSYFHRRRQTFRKDLVLLDKNLIDENADEFQSVMSRGMYNWKNSSRKISLMAGYEVNYETAKGQRIKDLYQWMGDAALFTSIEFKPLKTLLIKTAVRGGVHSRYALPVIPALHIKYDITKQLSLRGSYSRGFRAPSLKELFFEFVDMNHTIFGNPNLKAENSHQFNATLNYGIKKDKWNFNIQVLGFYNDIQDQIRSVAVSITPDSLIYRNENINRFQSVGAQINATVTYADFTIAVAGSYSGVINSLNDLANGNNTFVFYPEIQTTTGYNFTKWGGALNVFVKYNGKQPVLYSRYDEQTKGDILEEGFIDAFTNLDVSYTQKLFKNRLLLGVYGKNLLNVTNVIQTAGLGISGPHSSGSAFMPAMWGATVGLTIKYNFIVN
jgi:outer membrane receptor for ferrienterochelin and colicins